MNDRGAGTILHVAAFLFVAGFMVFFWMIYRKLRKVVRRTRKMMRREKAYNRSRS